MDLLWFFPTPGDSHYLGTSISGRTITPNYLKRLARVIDSLEFTGALLPTGKEAWLAAASLMQATKRMKFLVANRPDIASPGVAARIAAEYSSSPQASAISWVEPGSLLDRKTDPLSNTLNNALSYDRLPPQPTPRVEQIANYQGQYLRSKTSTIKHVDLYLAWGKSPEQVAEKVAGVRKLAAESGRLLHVIVRETEAEAWEAANQLIEQLDRHPTAAWLMDYAEQGID